MPEEETIIDDSQVHSFVRGEASEHIITALANIGSAQVSTLKISRPTITRDIQYLSMCAKQNIKKYID
jgi:glutamine phosphoribosylpyrophosphate amidotransferase